MKSGIFEYPGIESTPSQLIMRTVGLEGSSERLGAGIVRKSVEVHHDIDRVYPYYAAVYVVRGKGKYVLKDGSEFPIGPGSILQRIPGVQHSTIVDQRYEWIEFYVDLTLNLYRALHDMRIIRNNEYVLTILPDPALELRFYEIIKQLEQVGEEQMGELAVKSISLVVDLMQRAHNVTGKSSENKMIEEACGYFKGHISKRFDIPGYCRQKGWGYERFRKLFKEKLGISPGKYIQRHRMDKAAELLSGSTDIQISEVAEILGYSSVHEFSAQFRRNFGCPPTAFKQFRS